MSRSTARQDGLPADSEAGFASAGDTSQSPGRQKKWKRVVLTGLGLGLLLTCPLVVNSAAAPYPTPELSRKTCFANQRTAEDAARAYREQFGVAPANLEAMVGQALHGADMRCPGFPPDYGERYVRIWDPKTGTLSCPYHGHWTAPKRPGPAEWFWSRPWESSPP